MHGISRLDENKTTHLESESKPCSIITIIISLLPQHEYDYYYILEMNSVDVLEFLKLIFLLWEKTHTSSHKKWKKAAFPLLILHMGFFFSDVRCINTVISNLFFFFVFFFFFAAANRESISHSKLQPPALHLLSFTNK